MIGRFARVLRDCLIPEKRPSNGVELTVEDREAMFAVFEAVTGHASFSPYRFLSFLEARPDLNAEMKAGVDLVDRAAKQRFKGLSFAKLTSDARQGVLEILLRKFPHRANEASMLNRLGLTARNLDLLRTRRAVKSFRQFVVREFLAFYYDEPEGWKVAGYDKARGHALEEQSDGEISEVRIRKGEVQLVLADGTFEAFDRSMFVKGEPGWIMVKGGRQRAAISDSLRAELVELSATQGPKEEASVQPEGAHA